MTGVEVRFIADEERWMEVRVRGPEGEELDVIDIDPDRVVVGEMEVGDEYGFAYGEKESDFVKIRRVG